MTRPVDIAGIDSSIRQLELYLVADEIEPLLSALRDIKADPENESCLTRLTSAFDDLGPRQGAVLTYAPYVGILLSDDPFEIDNFKIFRDGDASQ